MKQTLREAAAESTHTAAERGAAALELAIERLMPLLEQAAEVSRVKRFESGVVDNPITLRADQTLADAKALQDRRPHKRRGTL